MLTLGTRNLQSRHKPSSLRCAYTARKSDCVLFTHAKQKNNQRGIAKALEPQNVTESCRAVEAHAEHLVLVALYQESPGSKGSIFQAGTATMSCKGKERHTQRGSEVARTKPQCDLQSLSSPKTPAGAIESRGIWRKLE